MGETQPHGWSSALVLRDLWVSSVSHVPGDTRETLPTAAHSLPVCPASVLDTQIAVTQIQEDVSVSTIQREISVTDVSQVTMVTLKMAPSTTVSPAPALMGGPVLSFTMGMLYAQPVKKAMGEICVIFVWMVTMAILKEDLESTRITELVRSVPVMITLTPTPSATVIHKVENA